MRQILLLHTASKSDTFLVLSHTHSSFSPSIFLTTHTHTHTAHTLSLTHVCMYTYKHRSRQVNCTVQLKELISTARYARCRSRFVVPVILFENKVEPQWLVLCYTTAPYRLCTVLLCYRTYAALQHCQQWLKCMGELEWTGSLVYSLYTIHTNVGVINWSLWVL